MLSRLHDAPLALLRRSVFACCLLLGPSIVTPSAADGQSVSYGGTRVGYGWLNYDYDDLDEFVVSFNSLNDSLISGHLSRFEKARGWYFDIEYTVIYGNFVGMAIGGGLHKYGASNAVTFVNGERQGLDLDIQDLTGHYSIQFYSGRWFVGPTMTFSRRRIKLDSGIEGIPEIGFPDEQLSGEYSASSYTLNWGAVVGVSLGRLAFTFRWTRTGSVWQNDRLFDGSTEKLGTEASYFPRDYTQFRSGALPTSQNAVTTAIRSKQFELSANITFPF